MISGTGAYAGMTALQTPYQIDVTAKTSTGGEVHLSRTHPGGGDSGVPVRDVLGVAT